MKNWGEIKSCKTEVIHRIPPMYAEGYNGERDKAVMKAFERVMNRKPFPEPAEGAASW